MKPTLKHTSLAIAIAALCAPSIASAEPDGGDGGVKERDKITYENNAKVDLAKKIAVDKKLSIEGKITASGQIHVDGSAMATVDNKQINHDNKVLNLFYDNSVEAKVDGNKGNVGANAAAGDNNQQANEVAVAAADGKLVFQADAEAFSFQHASKNFTDNFFSSNKAKLHVNGNTGNVGANAAAGDSNQQKNVVVAAVADSALAEATSYIKQELRENVTVNDPSSSTKKDGKDFGGGDNSFKTNAAILEVAGNQGNVGANVAAGTNNQQYNGLELAVSHAGAGLTKLVQ